MSQGDSESHAVWWYLLAAAVLAGAVVWFLMSREPASSTGYPVF